MFTFPNRNRLNRLMHKVDVYRRRDNGWSALHQACAGGFEKIVHVLLQEMRGTFLNVVAKDQQTPLSLAVWNNHPSVVRLLSRDGRVDVDVALEGQGGKTAFHIAAQQGFLQVVEVLSRNKKVKVEREDVKVSASCVGVVFLFCCMGLMYLFDLYFSFSFVRNKHHWI